MKSRTIESQIFGTLTEDEQIKDFWESEPIFIPFLDGIKCIATVNECHTVNPENGWQEVEKTMKNFLALTPADKEAAGKILYNYCKQLLNVVEYPYDPVNLRNMADPQEIWEYAKPMQAAISYSDDNNGVTGIYLFLTLTLDWQERVQLTFKNGNQLVRVSEIDLQASGDE